MVKLICNKCGLVYPPNYFYWKCDCEGLLRLEHQQSFCKDKIIAEDLSLWRYRHILPLESEYKSITMKEGMTPLLPLNNANSKLLLKLEYLCPTGSFKDRGSTVLISVAKSYKVKDVVEDSSGNAGASIAAYCARAGIKCHIFVPASAKEEKVKRIEGFGAQLTKVEGPRQNTTDEALKEAESTYYASHWANPFFFQGTKTFALEVWEQLNYCAPDALVMPVGHGSLLLGSYIGFRELKKSNLIKKLPRLIAVQSEQCSPIYSQFAGLKYKPSTKVKLLAEGIAVTNPPRKEEILQAIKDTKGLVCTVSDNEIYSAWRELCSQGFFVELTSAVALAGYNKLLKKELAEKLTVVIPLTGRN